MAADTPESAHARLTATFLTGATLPAEHRLRQLRLLHKFVHMHEGALCAALETDMGRPHGETIVASLVPLYTDINHMLHSLRRLMRPRILSRRMVAKVVSEAHAKGAVLVMAPFNFPVMCALRPVVAALAAGNCVALKLSEHAPATAQVLARLCGVLDRASFAIVQGEADVAQRLTELPWDHILFTGSPGVGKLIMRAAAKHLTPVTLELGGKNPAVVAADADVHAAAVAIAQGRFLNSGQICLAPDYCMVESVIYDSFVESLVAATRELFSEDAQQSAVYGRLSPRQYPRVATLLKQTKGEIVHGGQTNAPDSYMSPTIVKATLDDVLLQEEIFGPILPVVRSPSLDHATAHINSQPAPLALYVFTRDTRGTAARIVQCTRSGSVGVNETLLQVFPKGAFLSGVGHSGMGGGYGADEGFRTFSHQRVVMCSTPRISRLTHRFVTPQSMSKPLVQRVLRTMAGEGLFRSGEKTAKQ